MVTTMLTFVSESETSITLFIAPSLEVAEICGDCVAVPELITIYKLVKYYLLIRLFLTSQFALIAQSKFDKIWFFHFLIAFRYWTAF